jgi:hypothetical protein
MDVRAVSFRLNDEACGGAPINNEALMFNSHHETGEPDPCGCPASPASHLLEAAPREKKAAPTAAEASLLARLNAFFAISVNSPAMSMVNFSCCVCSAQKSCVSGVTRKMAPQPMCAAVRMEAGAHARL